MNFDDEDVKECNFQTYIMSKDNKKVIISNKYIKDMDAVVGAEIIPYHQGGLTNSDEIYLLLGREKSGSGKGKYSGFGGKREDEDGDDLIATACREAYEETTGLFGDKAILRKCIRYPPFINYNTTCPVNTSPDKKFCSFVMYTSDRDFNVDRIYKKVYNF